MILPVTFGAGPSAALARSHPEEVAPRPQGQARAEHAPAEGGESRVSISPAGAQRAQAEAGHAASQRAAAESALDLAFDAADGNRDGTVTISEQKTYEVRTVRLNIRPPADGRPGPAGSGPIRAYLDVDSTFSSL